MQKLVDTLAKILIYIMAVCFFGIIFFGMITRRGNSGYPLLDTVGMCVFFTFVITLLLALVLRVSKYDPFKKYEKNTFTKILFSKHPKEGRRDMGQNKQYTKMVRVVGVFFVIAFIVALSLKLNKTIQLAAVLPFELQDSVLKASLISIGIFLAVLAVRRLAK